MHLVFYLDDGLICGGSERVALRLLRHWTDLGWTLSLVTRSPLESDFYEMPDGVRRYSLDRAERHGARGGAARRQRGRRWTLRRLVPGRVLLRLGYDVARLRTLLRRLEPDVVVSFLTPANVKMILATFGMPCGRVTSERSDTRSYIYPWPWPALRRLLYRRADIVTANSGVAIADMQRYVAPSRLLYVPNPVALPPPDRLAMPGESRRILSIGRLMPHKRHMLLLEAFARVAERIPGWELHIVGDGPMRGELETAIATHGLAARVRLHGLVTEVDEHYRAAALFVLPSAVEGTPNVLLEAMAHGLPAVVSDALAGTAPYVEDEVTGALFASGSADDLALRIEALAASASARCRLGTAARARMARVAATDAYASWDRVILSALQPASPGDPTP
jgi:glycosyltransferase involved in cell wall biosynthesis